MMSTDQAPFDKPVPRQHASPSRRAKIQAQNRRREYLERHPSYFDSLDHELADPILYERLIKRFQTAQERAEEGKAKGYGRTLEASLIRGETNLANMSASRARGTAVAASFSDLSLSASEATSAATGNGTAISAGPSEESMLGEHTWQQQASEKEQGQRYWKEYLEYRFVHGQDDEFDYGKADEDQDLDVLEHKDAEETWYDEEEPSWVDDDDGDARLNGHDSERRGETGVQDY